ELDLRRVIERVLILRFQSFRWTELKQLHAFERPAVRSSNGRQLVHSLGQCDVNGLLAGIAPVQQELQSKRGLPCTRVAFDQVHPIWCETADQKFIETRDSRGDGRRKDVG